MENRADWIRVMTHGEMLRENGFDICSPISGSMKPLIRPRRDSVLFVPPVGRLKRYDVALYRCGDKNFMHRVIQVETDRYVIRGDNSYVNEIVYDGQIMGVMKGFYRDDTYYDASDFRYRLYAALWPKLNVPQKYIRALRTWFFACLRRICKKREGRICFKWKWPA